MSTQSQAQLFIYLNQGLQSVIFRRRAVAVDVLLHASLRSLTSLGEFFDQVVRRDVLCRCALNQLKKDLGCILGFLNPRCQFVQRRQSVLSENPLVGLLL